MEIIYESIKLPHPLGVAYGMARRWTCRACGEDRYTLVHDGSLDAAGRPMTFNQAWKEYGRQTMNLTDRGPLSSPWNDKVYPKETPINGFSRPSEDKLFGLPHVACGMCSEHTVISPLARWRIGSEQGRWDFLLAMTGNEAQRHQFMRQNGLSLLPLLPLE
jgi:hypothetical protein